MGQAAPKKDFLAPRASSAQKVILLGDLGAPVHQPVGKTSLRRRWAGGEFPFTADVMEADLAIVRVELKPKPQDATLTIFDTAGLERWGRFRSACHPGYFRRAAGVFVVFDVTCRQSFQHVQHWMYEVDSAVPFCHRVLLGNKADLQNHVVSEEEAQELAEAYGMTYLATSAKSERNLSEALYAMACRLPAPESERLPCCAAAKG
ncbi:unnamed protein product [Effrenium voratum]|uniref:Uncharacterized protein n=2 Tax=Effrenium voratum TaxID=2562239 RepID=A0AA36IXY9_9DINO|nr:unnamed protein product [Effrenium voratum]CAJ1415960.1 unnamed protein product [Effrenium voratum]